MTLSLFFPHKAQSRTPIWDLGLPSASNSWSVPLLWGVSLQKPLPRLPLSRLSFPSVPHGSGHPAPLQRQLAASASCVREARARRARALLAGGDACGCYP